MKKHRVNFIREQNNYRSKICDKNVRALIKKRDNYKCRICGIKSNIAHHLDNNPANNTLENLITVCIKHHGLLHRKQPPKLTFRDV
jgi:5-methylcytosine-specific restriction endonuclease McrA